MDQAIPEHIHRILDLARWAPSGDNTQPWRFEILGDEHVLVHGFDTRDHIVYDLDGHASQLAVGALLETLSIAASGEGRRAHITRRPETPETHLLFDVHLEHTADISPDPLVSYIETRVVQRRPMSTQPLSIPQKLALTASLPPGYRVVWFEGAANRWRLARFMFDNAKIRLTIPEGFPVHSTIIEWGAQFSEGKIPDQAVGVDPLTARLMRWVMASDWARVEFFNKYLMGDLPPRIQLDLLPGISCAAHFALLTPASLQSPDDHLVAGRAMQRFWLTAASLGLYIQPEMTPVIFTRYHRQGRNFTQLVTATDKAGKLNARLADFLPDQDLAALYFMGRIGTGPSPRARSTRKPVAALMQHS
jgi:nitroreductase